MKERILGAGALLGGVYLHSRCENLGSIPENGRGKKARNAGLRVYKVALEHHPTTGASGEKPLSLLRPYALQSTPSSLIAVQRSTHAPASPPHSLSGTSLGAQGAHLALLADLTSQLRAVLWHLASPSPGD